MFYNLKALTGIEYHQPM